MFSAFVTVSVGSIIILVLMSVLAGVIIGVRSSSRL